MINRVKFLFLFALFAVFVQIRNVYAISLTEYLYLNATRGNLTTIQNYLKRGYNVDATDGNGMTALCYAVVRKDMRAYQILKKLGASSHKECMRNIGERQTQGQTQRVQRLSSTTRRTMQTRTASSRIASGGDNTAKNAAIGLIVAGAATTAALLGHSGGGGHSYYPKPDSHDCPTGQEWNGTTCAPIECPTGQHLEGNDCVDNDDCPTGQKWNGSQCVDIECEEGTHLEGDACVPDTPTECPTGQRLVDGVCVDIECPTNTHLVGNRCVADDIDENHTGDDNLYGVYSDNERIYNLYSSPTYPDDEASIALRNQGNGDVYGMYGYGGDTEVFNAYVIGKDDNGNENKKPAGVANISITDNGSGTVYGMYSQITDITQYKEAINSSGWNEGTATGNIDIVHTGGGTTYGILGDVRAYNTFIANGGTAYGNINITGDGDIYGISGYVAGTNAVNYWFGNYNEARININSIGDGDVYGIMINKGDVPGAGGTGQSWFAFNAYTSIGGTSLGVIDIHNTGNGNVYGMYGGQQLYNAMSVGGVDEEGNPASHPYGQINIVNLGNGDSYGMYLPEKDDKGIIKNANENGSDSKISIVNAGSGTATGLRGGEETTIINSGEIAINNIGEGVAIGIYGEANSNITNGGSISISRQSYDDNGTIYSPATVIGGTAYGIYAESGSTVNNSGEIVITNASAGKGIYVENGATLINSGTVTFNGEVQDENIGVTDVNLQNLGGGEIILEQNGQFFADTLSGTLSVSNQSVFGSMEDEYNLGNALQVNNVDNLKLSSKSAMFNAQKVKNDTGYDVVLTRKNFDDLVNDASLAQFLELNYEEGNNVKLYDKLKAQATPQGLNSIAATVSGDNIIPSFRREDAQVYSHLSRQFNDNLFNHPEQRYVGGYKYIDISRHSDGILEGNDGEAQVAYGMLKNKANNGITYGLGATVSQLKSDYDHGSKRRNNAFGLWAPLGYNLGEDTQLVSKFYVGYADGKYDRKSLGVKYSADTKAYQYGLSNEMRYNIGLGSGLKLIPTAELNLLGIHQDGFNEGLQANALHIDDYDSLSLEGGLGAYLAKEFEFDRDNKLGIQIGGIYYVEFLDPDDGINASMIGMNHKYKINHKFDDKRAVFSARVNYNYKNITLF